MSFTILQLFLKFSRFKKKRYLASQTNRVYKSYLSVALGRVYFSFLVLVGSQPLDFFLADDCFILYPTASRLWNPQLVHFLGGSCEPGGGFPLHKERTLQGPGNGAGDGAECWRATSVLAGVLPSRCVWELSPGLLCWPRVCHWPRHRTKHKRQVTATPSTLYFVFYS